jgi:IS30 family transposase
MRLVCLSNGVWVILVLNERVTRQELIFKIKEKSQKCVVSALDKLERLHGSNLSKIFKSITVYNGTENLDFESMEKSIYTNKCNKLIRRFIPKALISQNLVKKK